MQTLMQPQLALRREPPTCFVSREQKFQFFQDLIIGRVDAPVTLVEFGDYQCPFCKRFHTDAFAELKKNYIDTGKVRFVSRAIIGCE